MCLIGILFVFFQVYHACAKFENGTDIRSFSVKCIEGAVVLNNCVKCVCESDNAFHCQKKPCKDVDENILFGKPHQATCIPLMMYSLDSITCVCSKYGYWPNDRCEIAFKSLQKQTLPKPVKCEADSYVIVECNVCRCSSTGFIDKQRCTKNDCSNGKIKRRTLTNVLEGSCKSGTWYSLRPCQFCHCVSDNKLICNAGASEPPETIERRNYKLTSCGKNLLNEIVELVPNSSKALRDREDDKLDQPDEKPDQDIERLETLAETTPESMKHAQEPSIQYDGSSQQNVEGNRESSEEDIARKSDSEERTIQANRDELSAVKNPNLRENIKDNEEEVNELAIEDKGEQNSPSNLQANVQADPQSSDNDGAAISLESVEHNTSRESAEEDAAEKVVKGVTVQPPIDQNSKEESSNDVDSAEAVAYFASSSPSPKQTSRTVNNIVPTTASDATDSANTFPAKKVTKKKKSMVPRLENPDPKEDNSDPKDAKPDPKETNTDPKEANPEPTEPNPEPIKPNQVTTKQILAASVQNSAVVQNPVPYPQYAENSDARQQFPVPRQQSPIITSEKPPEQTTEDPNIVRIQLPNVLDRLLQLAMRKSMVTLEKTEAKCTPGTSTRNKCSFCYCLVNGKMLCTAKDENCH